jgi:hypothetical protein
MKVRYRVGWGVVFLVIGGIELILGVLALGEVQLVLGVVFIVFGVLSMTRPYFEWDSATKTIAVKALVGPWARRFGGAEGGRLEPEADRIVWVRADGSRKKIPVRRFYANRDEWNAVLRQIAEPSSSQH